MSKGLEVIRGYAQDRNEQGYEMRLGCKGMQELWDACQADADKIAELKGLLGETEQLYANSEKRPTRALSTLDNQKEKT